MNGMLKEKIKSSGLKKRFISDHLEISPSLFSQIMKGRRTLSSEREAKLRRLLEKY